MEIVLRCMAIYVVVWLVFRISGKRTLKDLTTFDFVLLLIISECTQQGLVGQNYSVTGAAIAVSTLVTIDILLSLLKRKYEKVEKVLDNVPVQLIERGHLHPERLRKERVDEADILVYARQTHGISRIDEIDYAILETSGTISIIPKVEIHHHGLAESN